MSKGRSSGSRSAKVTVRSLDKSYDSLAVLRNISLEVEPSDVLVLIGAPVARARAHCCG